MCANTGCRHWAKTGCKLFNGQSWRLCRRAVQTRTNKTKQPTKGKTR